MSFTCTAQQAASVPVPSPSWSRTQLCLYPNKANLTSHGKPSKTGIIEDFGEDYNIRHTKKHLLNLSWTSLWPSAASSLSLLLLHLLFLLFCSRSNFTSHPHPLSPPATRTSLGGSRRLEVATYSINNNKNCMIIFVSISDEACQDSVTQLDKQQSQKPHTQPSDLCLYKTDTWVKVNLLSLYPPLVWLRFKASTRLHIFGLCWHTHKYNFAEQISNVPKRVNRNKTAGESM